MGVVTSSPQPSTSELPFDPASSFLTTVVGTLHPPPLDNGSGALLLLSLGPHLPQTIVIEGWTRVGQWGLPPVPPPPGPVLCRIDY